MKRIAAAVLAGLMLASLSACAGVADPNAGIYECTELISKGVSLAPDAVLGSGMNQVGLKSNGSGILIVDGEEFRIKWKCDGDRLTVLQDEDKFEGTLSDGVMTLEYEGVTFLLLRADAAERLAQAEETPAPQSEETAVQEFWNGEWYGWWIIESGSGSYEGQDYSWWDCCAEIEISGSGEGSITVWDEQCDRQLPLAKADVETDSGESAAGLLISTGGQFKSSVIDYGQWVIEPGEYSELNEPLIIIDGEYTDSDDSGSGFSYYIYLRPWGVRWEDIENSDPSQLPRYYYDWYLPLIGAGSTAPDAIRPETAESEPLPSDGSEPSSSQE